MINPEYLFRNKTGDHQSAYFMCFCYLLPSMCYKLPTVVCIHAMSVKATSMSFALENKHKQSRENIEKTKNIENKQPEQQHLKNRDLEDNLENASSYPQKSRRKLLTAVFHRSPVTELGGLSGRTPSVVALREDGDGCWEDGATERA